MAISIINFYFTKYSVQEIESKNLISDRKELATFDTSLNKLKVVFLNAMFNFLI
jgi:hypothetical protein